MIFVLVKEISASHDSSTQITPSTFSNDHHYLLLQQDSSIQVTHYHPFYSTAVYLAGVASCIKRQRQTNPPASLHRKAGKKAIVLDQHLLINPRCRQAAYTQCTSKQKHTTHANDANKIRTFCHSLPPFPPCSDKGITHGRKSRKKNPGRARNIKTVGDQLLFTSDIRPNPFPPPLYSPSGLAHRYLVLSLSGNEVTLARTLQTDAGSNTWTRIPRNRTTNILIGKKERKS